MPSGLQDQLLHQQARDAEQNRKETNQMQPVQQRCNQRCKALTAVFPDRGLADRCFFCWGRAIGRLSLLQLVLFSVNHHHHRGIGHRATEHTLETSKVVHHHLLLLLLLSQASQ